MGEVYRARDTRLDRTVAIKVLPSEVANNPERRARFEREARAVSSLNHPHICTLHDIGREGDTDYIVMEHLDGESLADRLAKGPLPLDQALRHAAEIADALDKAHRHGIVHRDLKPGNVMLTKSGAKLLDFGLAKLDLPSPAGRGVGGEGLSALATREKPLTEKGVLIGTYQYMAPEQLEGKDADARADIFAFGSVLYEMVTGKRAFEGTSQASLIGAILKDEPQPISALQPMTPPGLERLVRQCLAKDPDDRRQSAHDIVADLRWIAEAGSQRAAGPAGAQRSARFAWALAAVATLAAVGALLLRSRSVEAPTAPRMILSILPPPGGAWTDWFALSPDGRRLALVGSNEGRMQIWIRRLDEEEAHPVAGTDGAEDPFWSPDSRELGFFAQSKLKRIDLESGAVQVLCDAGLGRGGAWSREGVILFTGTAPGLSRVSASGGAPVPATWLEASRHDSIHRWPQFLPDGKRFILFVWAGKPELSGIYLGALGSQEVRLLLPSRHAGQFLPPDRLLYVRGDALVTQRMDLERAQPVGEPETLVRQVDPAELAGFLCLFSVSQNGIVAYRDAGSQRPLVWFDRRGKVASRTSAVASTAGLSLSPDESLAAYSSGTLSASDVWTLDLKRDVPTKLTSGFVATSPRFSRDGRFVYYRFAGSGHFEIRRKPVHGGGPEETVFEGAAFETPQDETPDGKTLIVQNTQRGFDLWTLQLGGARKLEPLVATEASERTPRLSPDGHWLAYVSDETARLEVYVRRFPVTEEKWQLSPRGGIGPCWRGDGKEIYYVGLDGALMAAPVSAGQTFSMGVPELLFQTNLRVWSQTQQYAPSRDGQRFLIVHPTQDPAASPLHVLLNWHPSAEAR